MGSTWPDVVYHFGLRGVKMGRIVFILFSDLAGRMFDIADIGASQPNSLLDKFRQLCVEKFFLVFIVLHFCFECLEFTWYSGLDCFFLDAFLFFGFGVLLVLAHFLGLGFGGSWQLADLFLVGGVLLEPCGQVFNGGLWFFSINIGQPLRDDLADSVLLQIFQEFGIHLFET